MTSAQTGQPAAPRSPRLWPGVVAAALLLLLRFVVPPVAPDAAFVGILGGFFCALAVFVWWAFFSRFPRPDRWGAVVLMLAALALIPSILHESIAKGAMGATFFLHAIPTLAVALVVWALCCRGLATIPRRASLAAAILLACGVWALLRTDGIHGSDSEFAWRWTPTAEERLLAETAGEPAALEPDRPAAELAADPATPQPAAANPDAVPSGVSEHPALAPAADAKIAPNPKTVEQPVTPQPAAPESPSQAEWPGFRGAGRDGVVRGLRIASDWSASPPVELWRRPVGPGWSSFAVDGDLLYTQEQRGEDEIVACYKLSTGEPVWRHSDQTRFWESNAGAGPRATPELGSGHVYSFGATGILNALNARTGAAAWSRNVASDTGVKVPYWGFASSPLVAGGVVIVAAAGELAAYDRSTGETRWTGPAHGDGYSSPQRLTIDGVPQILLLSSEGATGVSESDGKLLWEHPWPGFASLQPAWVSTGDVLIATSGATGGLGIRRLSLARDPTGWTVTEDWTSSGLKPYFNDFVVNNGYAYGFDGRILSCIDLIKGERKWKGGRYGNGQLVLLADQGLLLVLSDAGELALVRASPDGFEELARVPAIEGKTWNHPAVAGGIVLVRNDREMAAFRLPPESR